MKIKRKSRNLLITALVVLVSITGCSSDNGIKFESSDKDFEVQLQKGFEKGDVTKTDEPEGYVYSFEREGEFLDISEFVMPGITLNEEMIEEELHMSTEMEVLRMDNIDLGDRGKFYGVLVQDPSTGMYMIYHRIQKGDKIISFLNYKSIPFTIEEEAEHKAMISTIEWK